ncbi:peptide deformylase [Rickettsia endosymbiont of Cardiosporidium cionae]|uniref:peptide deformylase n=1 Tax=Rickettsia endosymbiont of Cardiosporidium cionae TaxID=2777155 RepID=UPI00189361FA|nr:peptide deformylase [Rickettsia endosymbiont of Cardiosporidium cionae]KAF8818344.1 peptide deformylase [Rickettsia endosymbiont of Cardiosporidium cionae]
MSILKIITVPNPVLKKKSVLVESIDDDLRSTLDSMLNTMYLNGGIGLAAVQVGLLKRMMVIDLRHMELENQSDSELIYPLYIINPQIIDSSKDFVTEYEGCLSIPGENVEVSRPSAITLSYTDNHNISQKIVVRDFLARVIQHENDHLNGKLIIDYLGYNRRNIVLSKINKFNKKKINKVE